MWHCEGCHTIFLQQGTQKFHRVLDVGVKFLWPGTALSDGAVSFMRVCLCEPPAPTFPVSAVSKSFKPCTAARRVGQEHFYNKNLFYETRGVYDTKQHLYQECFPAVFAPNICHRTSQRELGRGFNRRTSILGALPQWWQRWYLSLEFLEGAQIQLPEEMPTVLVKTRPVLVTHPNLTACK